MSMDFIRKRYGVTVKRGDRVRYSGGDGPREGVVTGATAQYLRVRLDGDAKAGRYHPTWRLERIGGAA